MSKGDEARTRIKGLFYLDILSWPVIFRESPVKGWKEATEDVKAKDNELLNSQPPPGDCMGMRCPGAIRTRRGDT
jgi:hypothetical protein